MTSHVKRSSKGIWLLLAAGLTFACTRVDPAAELASAEQSFSGNDYRTAMIHLSNVLQAEPNNADAFILRGRLMLALSDAAGAAQDFGRASAAGAPAARIAVDFATALLRSGQHERALSILDASSDALDSESDFWNARGEALLLSAQLDAAEDALDRSNEIAPESSRNTLARAQLAMLRGDTGRAQMLLSEAVALAPSNPQALFARGAFLAGQNRVSEAMADLQLAADSFSNQPGGTLELNILSMLVQLQLASDGVDEAAQTVSRLRARAPNSAVTAYSRGLVAYQQGNLQEAVTALSPLVNAQPDNPRPLALLGAAHLGLGNLGQAEQSLIGALAASPSDIVARRLLAETRIRQGRPDAALEALQATGNPSDDPQLDVLRGLVSLQANRLEQAISFLERAVSADPSNFSAKLQLARAYFGAGRNDDATALLGEPFGADSGLADLNRNLMLLIADMRSGDVEAGRARADSLVAEFPDQASALTTAAAAYQLVGERQAAQEHLQRAVAIDETFVPARLLLSELLAAQGLGDQAESHLRQVLAIAPGHVQAVSALARLMAARGAAGEARTLLEEALEAAPAAEIQVLLAQLYMQQGDLARAEQSIAEASEQSPDNASVIFNRGLIALAAGRAADAVTDLEAALALSPNSEQVVLALSRAQVASNDLEGARDTLRDALEFAPRSVPVRSSLGAAYLLLGDVEDALELAQALKTEFPGQGVGYQLEGEVRVEQGQYDAAVGSFAAAFERTPNWEVLSRQTAALRRADRAGEVPGLLNPWVDDFPEHMPGRLALAGILQEQGLNEDALIHYEYVLGVDGNNIMALNNAAWLYNEEARPDALSLAQRAERLAPSNPAVLDTLGWILAAQERYDEAIVFAEKATQLAPQSPEIRYHAALVQARLGRGDEARTALEALLAEFPAFSERSEARALLDSL